MIHTLIDLGQIYLPHLRICKYFMDVLLFEKNMAKSEEKPCHGNLQMSQPEVLTDP